MLPQSGGKSQFPLLARGAEGCGQLARWSSTPSATQQPCCISPSVFLRPLGTKIQLGPLAVNRSCFGCSLLHLRTAAACLSRCFRHWRRSKAKPLRGSRGGYRRKGTELAQCMPQQLRPPEAGGPHPSRCSAKAQHRDTFPKGKAKRCGGAPKAPSPNTHIQKSPAANAAGGLFRRIIPSSASDNGDGGGACDTCVCYRCGYTAQAR